MRTDGEQAIRMVSLDLAARGTLVKTLIEVTPARSSSSLGACERFSETISGMVRTLKAAAGRLLGIEIRANMPIFSYLVQHAVWLYNRYQVRRGGSTPFEQVNQRSYQRPILPFGTPVWLRRPDALLQTKLELRWNAGLWLGRLALGDENIAITDQGIVVSRTCRPMPAGAIQNMTKFLEQLDWGLPTKGHPSKPPPVRMKAVLGAEFTAPPGVMRRVDGQARCSCISTTQSADVRQAARRASTVRPDERTVAHVTHEDVSGSATRSRRRRNSGRRR